MRAVKVLAFAALLSACAVLGADELTWKSLFAPPYASMPEICLSIACVSRDLCYLPGGSNGQGFGVYSFNGQTNGEVMQMNEPNMTMMIMTAAAGGTTKNPRGAFGGFGMLSISDALQYLDNGTTWLPSHTPSEFIWVTQSMAATDDGQHIISLGSGPAGNSIMHSANSGLSFNPQVLNIPPLQADCTAPNYASMVSNQTWYITLGGYPGEHKNSNSGSGSNGGGSGSNSGSNGNNAHSIQTLKRNSAISALQRHSNGRVSHAHGRKAAKLPEVTDHCHFTGQIARTNDAGKTWEIMLNSTEYTLSQIDCVSANHCVTTGWGTLANNDTLVVVLTMTDGKTWKETLRLVNSPLSFNAVKFADAQEVWLAGGLDTQAAQAGAFYVSKDGGMTWSAFPGLIPDVVMIMDMDFTKDGVGFAVGMTVFKTATILRYEKQSFAGYFSQANCPFKGCSAFCQNVTFPQGMCMEAQGGSVIATCSETAIEQRVYNTTSCIGPYTVVPMPINQCINSTQGSFFENYCNTSALDATPRSAGVTML